MKKKISILVLFLFTVFMITGCTTTKKPIIDEEGSGTNEENETIDSDKLDIYYVNDFHGAIEASDNLGLSRVGNFLKQKKKQNPKSTLILAGGDMFQGSLMSNYFRGKSTLEMMNYIEFDAMTIGNHEFDWKLEEVTKYFDGNSENGEAYFPLLGANVFKKDKEELADNVDPYTIITKNNKKIGIIGTMGYKLESSISYDNVKNYEFRLPETITNKHAKYLKEEEKCDYVIGINHGGNGDTYNDALSKDIDIIFNAHTHRNYIDTNNKQTPVLQAGSNGNYVGHMEINLKEKKIEPYLYDDVEITNQNDVEIDKIIQKFNTQMGPGLEETIITAGEYMGVGMLTEWIAKTMSLKTNSVIGIHNNGGTRTDINEGEEISVKTLYNVLPFDNVIKSIELRGIDIKNFVSGNGSIGCFSQIPLYNLEDNSYYRVVTNDYVFDNPNNPFTNGSGRNEENHGIMRELVETVLRDIAKTESLFFLDASIPMGYKFIGIKKRDELYTF